MATQLEDVSNQVAQEKIGDSRLRNEAIRKQMQDPWTESTITTSGDTPTSLQNIYSNAGQTPTQASTYGSLLNNFKALGLDNGTDTNNNALTTDDTSGKSWTTQGWAAPAAGAGANLLGAGAYSGLGSAAVNFAQGNTAAGTGNLASTLTSLFNKGNVPGLSGAVGTLASGLMGDKSASEIGYGLANSGLGTLFTMANPLAGAAYSVARMLGFNPAQGIASMFDTRNYGEEGGHIGGFCTKPSEYTGYTPGQAYEPGTNNLSTGNTAGYSAGTAHYGYSNPAASYGGYTTSSSSDGGD